jgi:hypothetical protein
MVEKLKDYFMEHVQLASEFKNILVDFLGEEATTYTIEPIPVETIITPYTDGGSLRQFVFQFGSREFYDDGVAQNIENLDFYEKFKNEIETNNKNGVLPDIDGIQSIECTTGGTLDGAESGTAKYIIQMKIKYYKEA